MRALGLVGLVLSKSSKKSRKNWRLASGYGMSYDMFATRWIEDHVDGLLAVAGIVVAILPAMSYLLWTLWKLHRGGN